MFYESFYLKESEVTPTPPVITIDGPSGAGKGILCEAIAESLGWHLLDSGAIYRALAIAALHHQINVTTEKMLAALAEDLDIYFTTQGDKLLIFLEGEDVSNKISTETIGNLASQIAKLPQVREALLRRQRIFRKEPGLVADGRDMGTVVFPNALVKIFLDANTKERAQRRWLQLQGKGFHVNFKWLLAEMQERDNRDRHRAIAPLVPAFDAFVLDSTSLSIVEVTQVALGYIQKVMTLPKQ